MLSGLRDSRGRPTLRGRVLAVLLVVGLLALAAPALGPVVRAVFDALVTVLF